MILYEAICLCGNSYNQYIQLSWIGGRQDGKRSGVMKKGNITYKQLDHYGYGYEVYHIFPKFEANKKILFIQLKEKGND